MSDPQWGLLIYMYMLFLFFVLFLLSCAQMTSKAPAIDSSQRELSKSGEFLADGGTVVGRRSEVVWEGGLEGGQVRGVNPGIEKTLFKKKKPTPRQKTPRIRTALVESCRLPVFSSSSEHKKVKKMYIKQIHTDTCQTHSGVTHIYMYMFFLFVSTLLCSDDLQNTGNRQLSTRAVQIR